MFLLTTTTGQSQGRPGLCHAVKVSQPKVPYQRRPTSMHEIAEDDRLVGSKSVC